MTSSVVSFSKREITEEIPGMQYGMYRIPASNSSAEPSILFVEDSYYYKPDLEGRQDTVLVLSGQIAESIAHMHVTSQLASKATQHPAVFAIPNEKVSPSTLFRDYKTQVDDYIKRQIRWYEALVRIADDDWQQVRRHRMISDLQRTAAKELGLEREWLNTVYDEDKASCPFCGTGLLDSNAPICPTCGKVHNPIRMAELTESLSRVTTPAKVIK